VIPGGPRPLPAVEDAPTPAAAATDGDAAPESDQPDAGEPAEAAEGASKPTAVPIGEGEELIELSDEERAAVPTRSDDKG
jgi:hypothetical protein